MTDLQRLWGTLREDLPSLVLLALLLFVVAWSVMSADWVEGLGILPVVIIIGLVTSYLLAVSVLHELFVLFITSLYGWFTVWVLVGRLIPEPLTFRERLLELNFRLGAWVERALGGGFSRDNLIFLLLVALLAWLLTFNATWNLFRSRRLWLGVIPVGVALLVNVYHYFGPVSVELFILAFLFLTLLLAVSTNAVNREWMWRMQGAAFHPGIRLDLVRGGVVAIVLLLAGAWFAPTASANAQLASLWESPDNPWQEVQDTFRRLFNAVEGPAAVTPTYYGGSRLAMGGPISLSDVPVMTVYAPEGHRYYWQSKVFDTYADGQWTAKPEDRKESDFGILSAEREEVYRLRQNVQQQFELLLPATRILYAAPQPISYSSLPIYYDVIYTTPGEGYATVTAAHSRRVLPRGESYGATSAISIADETSLRGAGTNYPAWVTENYLDLPGSITQRTRDLAANITAGQATVYDQVRAIETYLRETITYNESVPPPPEGVEPIDYFLFESREGYCVYYASAMTVMLRSLGIPARIAAGFSQGTFDPEINGFVVLESDAHTWVQVYFPDYGWIDFEPTTAREPIVRSESLTLDEFTPLEAEPPAAAELPPDPFEELPPTPEIEPQAANGPGATASGPRWAWLGALLRWLGAFALLGTVMLVGVWAWHRKHGLHRLSGVVGSYARLNIFAPWLGVELLPSDTPYERAEAFRRRIPESARPVSRIVDLYVKEQYAPAHMGGNEARAAEEARALWARLRSLFLSTAVRQRLKRLNPFDGDISIR